MKMSNKKKISVTSFIFFTNIHENTKPQIFSVSKISKISRKH